MTIFSIGVSADVAEAKTRSEDERDTLVLIGPESAFALTLHLTDEAWEQLDRIVRHRWYDAQAAEAERAREFGPLPAGKGREGAAAAERSCVPTSPPLARPAGTDPDRDAIIDALGRARGHMVIP